MENIPEQEQVAGTTLPSVTNDGGAEQQIVEPKDGKAFAVEALPAENDAKLFDDKTENLIAFTNKTFQDLCKSLEEEHNKLVNLEERRKKLYEEMQQLKADIEAEKNSLPPDAEDTADYSSDMDGAYDMDEETTSSFLKRQGADFAGLGRGFDDCSLEMDANDLPSTSRNAKSASNETTKNTEAQTSSMANDI